MGGNARLRWQLHLPAMLAVICAPALALGLVGQSSNGANQFISLSEVGHLLLSAGVWWAVIPFMVAAGITLLAAVVVARVRHRQPADRARAALVSLWVGSIAASIGLFFVVGMFQTG